MDVLLLKTLLGKQPKADCVSQSALIKALCPKVYKHEDICRSPYDIFAAVIEGNTWGFGMRVADYDDQYGLRLQLWRKHYIWRLRKRA